MKHIQPGSSAWIINLDFSKAFDKIDWNALWFALRQQGISEHLIGILQCVYCGQTGVIRERDVDSCGFDIRGGARQASVLSPRFSVGAGNGPVLMGGKMEAEGLSLENLWFADDMWMFCTTLLLRLQKSVSPCKKRKILTTQAQPPKQLWTRGGVTVDVLDSVSPHKWLGCLLHLGGYHHADVDFHPQAASRVMQTDGFWMTDMCRWQLGFAILIQLSLQWLVLLQSTGRFSKMGSTMLACVCCTKFLHTSCWVGWKIP